MNEILKEIAFNYLDNKYPTPYKSKDFFNVGNKITVGLVNSFIDGFKEAEKTMYTEEDFKLFARQYFREIKMDKSNLLWETLADKCLEQFKKK